MSWRCAGSGWKAKLESSSERFGLFRIGAAFEAFLKNAFGFALAPTRTENLYKVQSRLRVVPALERGAHEFNRAPVATFSIRKPPHGVENVGVERGGSVGLFQMQPRLIEPLASIGEKVAEGIVGLNVLRIHGEKRFKMADGNFAFRSCLGCHGGFVADFGFGRISLDGLLEEFMGLSVSTCFDEERSFRTVERWCVEGKLLAGLFQNGKRFVETMEIRQTDGLANFGLSGVGAAEKLCVVVGGPFQRMLLERGISEKKPDFAAGEINILIFLTNCVDVAVEVLFCANGILTFHGELPCAVENLWILWRMLDGEVEILQRGGPLTAPLLDPTNNVATQLLTIYGGDTAQPADDQAATGEAQSATAGEAQPAAGGEAAAQ